nr:YkvA family protein [uncultured Devosia sp.]
MEQKTGFWTKVKSWAGRLKRDVMALWLAAGDPRTPWYAKAMAGAVAAYALSPIDLIPDFIPVLGYLDDLILLPLGIALAARMIPPPLMVEFRKAAEQMQRPNSMWGLFLVLAVWLIAAALTAWYAGRRYWS